MPDPTQKKDQREHAKGSDKDRPEKRTEQPGDRTGNKERNKQGRPSDKGSKR